MTTYRSKFEANFARQVQTKNIQYEKHVLPWVQPESSHKYTPDFKITGTNIFLELKGIFDALDRKKHLLIKAQYPQYRIILVFMRPTCTITKTSTTTYADWCKKNDIEWMTTEEAHELIKNSMPDAH